MTQKLIINQRGAPATNLIPGTHSQQFEVFHGLKAFRSLYFKDRKHYVVRIPAIMVNGYASTHSVSITPAVSENRAYLIIGLTDSQFKGGELHG